VSPGARSRPAGILVNLVGSLNLLNLLNLAVACASLLVVLAACEYAARRLRPDLLSVSDERISFCAYDSELGWRNRASVSGRFFGTRVAHNSRGQRDRERSRRKTPGHLRVMVVGDSFVWGYRVNARDRFTNRLEKLLPGSQIMNFGCSGYGQDQEYLLLQREMHRYAPDLVVVGVHVASDLENNVNSFQYGYYKPLFSLVDGRLVLGNVPVPRDALGARTNKWMTARSALWNLLGERTLGGVSLKTRFVNALDALARAPQAKAVRSKVPRVDMTCRLCAAIGELVEHAGARVLALLIPDVDVHDQSIHAAPEYDELRACLTAHSLPVLDLDLVFRAYHAANPRESITLYGDRHWSPTGHEVVSRALYAYLEQGRLLPAEAARPATRPGPR
jgi:hypothetical protein